MKDTAECELSAEDRAAIERQLARLGFANLEDYIAQTGYFTVGDLAQAYRFTCVLDFFLANGYRNRIISAAKKDISQHIHVGNPYDVDVQPTQWVSDPTTVKQR